MKRATAAKIACQLKRFGGTTGDYRITRIREGRPLRSFHEWADDKALISADRISRNDSKCLIVLLIDWAETGEFYCVIFPDTRSSPLAEIWSVQQGAGTENLVWDTSR